MHYITCVVFLMVQQYLVLPFLQITIRKATLADRSPEALSIHLQSSLLIDIISSFEVLISSYSILLMQILNPLSYFASFYELYQTADIAVDVRQPWRGLQTEFTNELITVIYYAMLKHGSLILTIPYHLQLLTLIQNQNTQSKQISHNAGFILGGVYSSWLLDSLLSCVTFHKLRGLTTYTAADDSNGMAQYNYILLFGSLFIAISHIISLSKRNNKVTQTV